jgi:hypothetical protein
LLDQQFRTSTQQMGASARHIGAAVSGRGVATTWRALALSRAGRSVGAPELQASRPAMTAPTVPTFAISLCRLVQVSMSSPSFSGEIFTAD